MKATITIDDPFTDLQKALFKVGVKYTSYHEDNSVSVTYKGRTFNIREVKINKDGSISKQAI